MVRINIVVGDVMVISDPRSISYSLKRKYEVKLFGLTSNFYLSKSMIISDPQRYQTLVSLKPFLIIISLLYFHSLSMYNNK